MCPATSSNRGPTAIHLVKLEVETDTQHLRETRLVL